MKNKILRAFTLASFALFLASPRLCSQLNVNSSNGYTVHVIVTPTTIIPSSYSCTWGYNYNVRLNYTVTFTGSNIPASLYTLQGFLVCGSSSNFFDLPNNGGVGTATSTSNTWNPANDCATATVNSLHCNNANIQINGPGISNQTLSLPITYSILPVELQAFTVMTKDNQVQLDWSTASEFNTSYFTVERSADGSQWEQLAKVAAAGTSNSALDYHFTDTQPLPGLSYYRLKQTDLDAHEMYLGTRTARTAARQSISISPVPNPGNTISIKGIAAAYGHYQLCVINAAGSIIFRTNPGSETITLPSLVPGIYLLQLTNSADGTVTNLRYVKI